MTAQSKYQLKQLEISGIVNCAHECENIFFENSPLQYLSLHLEDSLDQLLDESILLSVYQFIGNALPFFQNLQVI